MQELLIAFGGEDLDATVDVDPQVLASKYFGDKGVTGFVLADGPKFVRVEGEGFTCGTKATVEGPCVGKTLNLGLVKCFRGIGEFLLSCPSALVFKLKLGEKRDTGYDVVPL